MIIGYPMNGLEMDHCSLSGNVADELKEKGYIISADTSTLS